MAEENDKIERLSDEELMSRYKLGEYPAFEELYRRHSGRVYGFILKRIKSRERSEELFQESFLRLHRNRSRYNDSLPFLPWLFTIARSAMIDGVRADARSQRTQQSFTEQNLTELQAVPVSIDLGIQSLSSREKEAVELRYGSDLDFNAIAAKLNTSSTNVRQIVSRAVKKLRAGFVDR